MLLGIYIDDISFILVVGVARLAILVPISMVWETVVGAIYREINWTTIGLSAAETCLVFQLNWMLMVQRQGMNFHLASNAVLAPAAIVAAKLVLKIITALFHRRSPSTSAIFSARNLFRLVLYACGPGIALAMFIHFEMRGPT
jgi:hypothetical protein